MQTYKQSKIKYAVIGLGYVGLY